MACGADGSDETRVLDSVGFRGFMVLRDSIVYLRPQSNATELRRRMLANGEDVAISSIVRPLAIGLGVTRDGRYAIYSQIDREGSDLLLLEGLH